MAKDTFYFSHDYNARNDIKIKKLISTHGFSGYGLFWALIEELYNNTNVLPLDYECISFDLRCEKNILISLINDFGLFVINDGFFGSSSVEKRLNTRNEISQKAKESVNIRWEKYRAERLLNTSVLQSNYDSNTIKERKGKEIKENNIEERKLKFATTLTPFKSSYDINELMKFYEYWIEPNKSNTKFRQELEQTWDLKRRLKTWFANDKSFGNNIKKAGTPPAGHV